MKSYLLILLAAGLFSCTNTPPQVPAEVQQLTAHEFRDQNLSSKTMVVDVRTPEEFASGHLEGAINSYFRGGAFATEMQNWDKDKTYYLYCASGNRSGKAAELMKQAGFTKIVNVGAYQELKEAGLPTENGNQ